MLIAEPAMVIGSVGSATCCLVSKSRIGIRARVLAAAMAMIMVVYALNSTIGLALVGAALLIILAVIAAVPYRKRTLHSTRLHRVLGGPIMAIVLLTPTRTVSNAHDGHLMLAPLTMLVCAYLCWTIIMAAHRGPGATLLNRFESGAMSVSIVAMIAASWTASH